MGSVKITVTCWAGAQALHPLFRVEEDAGTRDNAAGAVGRIIATVGSQAPLEQVCARCQAPETDLLLRVSDRILFLPGMCPGLSKSDCQSQISPVLVFTWVHGLKRRVKNA